MKVVAFNGSARKEGNTDILIKAVLAELEAKGIETEIFNLRGTHLMGCTACGKCFEKKNKRCVIKNDALNECIEKMVAADGIILGSPTYFTDVSAEMKALIDRAGYVAKANGDMLQRKVGAGVVAVRRAGSNHVLTTINNFFLISQMMIPGSNYWNMGIGLDKGDVSGDDEGMETMAVLGRNMAWLMEKIQG
ncbi:MAG: flavodoxin family protein [Desulfobacter sp.]